MNYLLAKHEETQIRLYCMDLIALIAKHYYNGVTMPSEVYNKKPKVNRRSAKQIVDDVMNGLGKI